MALTRGGQKAIRRQPPWKVIAGLLGGIWPIAGAACRDHAEIVQTEECALKWEADGHGGVSAEILAKSPQPVGRASVLPELPALTTPPISACHSA